MNLLRLLIAYAVATVTLVTVPHGTNAYWQDSPLSVDGHPGCPSDVLISRGVIVDIDTSAKYGAKLLGGSWESSFSACITNCCGMEGCDLALYKVDGVSQTRKNCYHVQCGSPENCWMVKNQGFMSATVVTENGNGDGPGREGVQEGDRFEPETPLHSTIPVPNPTPSTSTEDTNKGSQTTEEPTKPDSPVEPSQPSRPDTTREPVPTQATTPDSSDSITPSDSPSDNEGEKDGKGKEEGEGSKNGEKGHGEGDETENQKPTNGDSEHLDSEGSKPPESGEGGNGNETAPEIGGSGEGDTDPDFGQQLRPVIMTNETGGGKKNSCEEDGCNGRGAIVVAVISSVVLLMIVVMSVIVIRHLANRRRKKRFRNVDYLINGMYT